jgi:hypothetical protein
VRLQFACTFDFPTKAPEAYRGEVTGLNVATCVARAIRAAHAALRPVGWSSCVVAGIEQDLDAEGTIETPNWWSTVYALRDDPRGVTLLSSREVYCEIAADVDAPTFDAAVEAVLTQCVPPADEDPAS